MGYSKIENRRILVYIFLLHHFPEAFHARFPVSVKSLKVSRSCIERIGPPRRTREKNLWYPGYIGLPLPDENKLSILEGNNSFSYH